MQRWVRRMWAGEAGVPGSVARTLLLPLEGAFRLALRLRERRFRPGARPVVRASIPVISVGNLSVGGTGKTPVASWVVRCLLDAGARPAVVARGYGDDELLLHTRWTPGVPVVAAPDRWVGVEQAAREGADVAVLDDGFQHRRLACDTDLVLVSAEEGLPGAVLPRGPFREPGRALERAHGVLVTRKEASDARAGEVVSRVRRLAPHAVVAVLRLRPGSLSPLEGHESGGAGGPAGRAPVRDSGGTSKSGDLVGPVLVATGVARPGSVEAAVRALGVEVAELVAFPDHHPFDAGDVAALVRRAAGRPLVVTEKDAVKLERIPQALEGDFHVLGQVFDWEEGRDAMTALVTGVVREGTP